MNTKNVLTAIGVLFTWLWVAYAPLAFADSPKRPTPLVFASSSTSDVVFSMIPAGEGQDAYGVVSRLDQKGGFVELYRTSGWYSFRVLVSHDGTYLVRLRSSNTGNRPQEDHLAVAFYKNGELLKSYSTARLVKDHQRVLRSVSSYGWQADIHAYGLPVAQQLALRPRLSWDNILTLHTSDGWTYEFDATTGEIQSTTMTAGH